MNEELNTEVAQPAETKETHDNETPLAQDDGPSSMLEAIEQGLSTKDEGETEAAVTDGRPRDEQGRFAKKEGEGDPAKADTKPADQAAKPEDDLSVPDGLSPRAQERFHALVERVKQREQEATTIRNDLEQFREVVKSSGASAQEFAQLIDYSRMVKSGDLEGALRVLDDQRKQIALALGRPLPGVDALSQFPDLQQRVQAYQMDEQAALEIARARVSQQQIQTAQREQEMRGQSEQQAVAVRQQAISQIDRMGAEWARTDPDYARKEEIIGKQLPLIAQQFPPHLWPQQVAILYQAVSQMPAPAAKLSGPAPLRPSGQSGGARQPGSMLEAMEMGLGYSQG